MVWPRAGDRRLDDARSPRTISGHGHQISDRHHAGPVAGGARRRGFRVGADRAVRDARASTRSGSRPARSRRPAPEVMTTLAATAADGHAEIRAERHSCSRTGLCRRWRPRRWPTSTAVARALLPAVGVGVELPREFEASGVPFREPRTAHRRGDPGNLRTSGPRTRSPTRRVLQLLYRIRVHPEAVAEPAADLDRGKSEAAMPRTARWATGRMPSLITPEEARVGVARVQEWAHAEGREVPPTTSAR